LSGLGLAEALKSCVPNGPAAILDDAYAVRNTVETTVRFSSVIKTLVAPRRFTCVKTVCESYLLAPPGVTVWAKADSPVCFNC
jgi:hypothetical protein